MPMAAAPNSEGVHSESGLSENALSVRLADRERFVTALFAPPERREDLLALYAFNCEIAAIRDRVSEPLLGQIRLQWWRDSLDKLYAGATIAHPVAAALGPAIIHHGLPRAAFDRLLDARESDLERAPYADCATLETYVAHTAGELAALAMTILGQTKPEDAADTVARQVGLAWGLTGVLRASAFNAAVGRLTLPRDILAAHGVGEDDVFAGRDSPGLRAVVRHLADRAAGFLAEARAGRRAVPRTALAALLPARLADGHLRALRRAEYRVTDPHWSAIRPRPLVLLAATLTGRY